jgi:hypothetical protein
MPPCAPVCLSFGAALARLGHSASPLRPLELVRELVAAGVHGAVRPPTPPIFQAPSPIHPRPPAWIAHWRMGAYVMCVWLGAGQEGGGGGWGQGKKGRGGRA